MARFRKMRRRAARMFKRASRRARRSYGGDGLMTYLISGAIYGAARAPIANAIVPLSSKLPFSGYNDEIAMMAASYAAMRFGPVGVIKNVGKVGLAIETASLVSQMTAGALSSGSNNSLFDGGGL